MKIWFYCVGVQHGTSPYPSRHRQTTSTDEHNSSSYIRMGIPAPGQRGVGHCLPGSFQGAGKKVDLRVIVPKADPSVIFDGFQLTGLNNVSYREVEQVDRKYSYDSFALVERAPIELDPYTTVEGGSGVVQFTKEGRITFSKTHEADLQLFRNKEDLYAGDLALKVIQFSKIAVKVALQQDFDIIHAHDWMTYLAGVEVKKPRASPWWCTCTLPSLTGPERMPAAGFTTLKIRHGTGGCRYPGQQIHGNHRQRALCH